MEGVSVSFCCSFSYPKQWLRMTTVCHFSRFSRLTELLFQSGPAWLGPHGPKRFPSGIWDLTWFGWGLFTCGVLSTRRPCQPFSQGSKHRGIQHQERTSPNVQALFKPLLVSSFPLAHWPKASCMAKP